MADNPVELKKSSPPPASAPTRSVDPWRSFRDEMDRVFERFSGHFGMPSLRRMFDVAPSILPVSSFSFNVPTVDVAEDDKAYKITAELPGLEDKDVEITITGDMLSIKGEKRQEEERKDENYHMTERAWGSFQRAFAVPDGVDRDNITAALSKGVLTVVLPKTAEAQKPVKKIEVKAG
jgi:HSP20 family protein